MSGDTKVSTLSAQMVVCISAASLVATALSGAPRATAPASVPTKTILSAHPTDLSALLAPICEKHKVPGMVAAILDGEQVTAIGATGVRKIGSEEPMTAGDVIHLGSCTKAMTATLIGKLVDEKKLDWDTPMHKALPKLAPAMDAEAAKITVAQLLAHTSGLPANVEWWSYDRTKQPIVGQRADIARDVLAKAPSAKPGEKYLYSNVGYVLLGAIVEDKRGQEWEKVIEKELFVPLGMSSAGFGPPGSTGKVDQPWGHTGEPGKLKPLQADNPPCLGPAGRVHCTMEDWARFVSVHLRAAAGHPQILSGQAFTTLHTPPDGMDYMGGWLICRREWGGTVLTHAGSNTMWYCVVWVSPKKDFAVFAATNTGQKDASTATDQACAALIALQVKAEH